MSSQRQFEIVKELQPLCDLFGKLTDAQLAIYSKALSHLESDKIKAVVSRVIQTYDKTKFPPVATLLGAMKDIHPSQPNTTTWKPKSQESLEAAKKLLDAYLANFQGSNHSSAGTVFQRSELFQYVKTVAWIQAQYLSGCERIGYESSNIFEGLPAMMDDAEINAFLYEQKRIAQQSGMIDVGIPARFLRQAA